MIIRKLLGPTNLTRAQTLSLLKLPKIIIVSKNQDLVFAAF